MLIFDYHIIILNLELIYLCFCFNFFLLLLRFPLYLHLLFLSLLPSYYWTLNAIKSLIHLDLIKKTFGPIVMIRLIYYYLKNFDLFFYIGKLIIQPLKNTDRLFLIFIFSNILNYQICNISLQYSQVFYKYP